MRIPNLLWSVSHFAQPVALVAALGLVVVLARQNDQLRTDVKRAKIESHIPRRGFVVPAFRTRTLAGDSVEVGRGSPEVMFFFTTTCPYCRRMIPIWETIAARARSSNGRFRAFGLGLGTDSSIRAYVHDRSVPFDVVEFPDSTIQELYRVEGVPLTLVLSTDGRIVLSRIGMLDAPVAVDSVIRFALAADSLAKPKSAPDTSQTRRS